MRLFVAINFDESTKDKIMETIHHIKAVSVDGNFTFRDNLHLTLVFLGELDNSRVKDIQNAMRLVTCPAFSLTINGLGTFASTEFSKLFWLAVKPNDALFGLYDELASALSSYNFSFESREYRPHLTIGREVYLKEGTDCNDLKNVVTPFRVDVNKIALMKSDRINGKVSYRELYSRHL